MLKKLKSAKKQRTTHTSKSTAKRSSAKRSLSSRAIVFALLGLGGLGAIMMTHAQTGANRLAQADGIICNALDKMCPEGFACSSQDEQDGYCMPMDESVLGMTTAQGKTPGFPPLGQPTTKPGVMIPGGTPGIGLPVEAIACNPQKPTCNPGYVCQPTNGPRDFGMPPTGRCVPGGTPTPVIGNRCGTSKDCPKNFLCDVKTQMCRPVYGINPPSTTGTPMQPETNSAYPPGYGVMPVPTPPMGTPMPIAPPMYGSPNPAPAIMAMNAVFDRTKNYAEFNFKSNRMTIPEAAPTYVVDVSTDPKMATDVYLTFAQGKSSPIVERNPIKWDKFSCGRVLYWTVRMGGQKSNIYSTRVTCVTQPTVKFDSLQGVINQQGGVKLSGKFSPPLMIREWAAEVSTDAMFKNIVSSPGITSIKPMLYNSFSISVGSNGTAGTNLLKCGQTVYWRVTGSSDAVRVQTPTQKTTVQCDNMMPVPTPVPVPEKAM